MLTLCQYNQKKTGKLLIHDPMQTFKQRIKKYNIEKSWPSAQSLVLVKGLRSVTLSLGFLGTIT